MFPEMQGGPQTGNGFTTATALAQNTGLLGNPPIQANAASGGLSNIGNSTAPQSSTISPNVANMVQALKGGTR